MSVSPSEFFYADISYVDTSNTLISFSNLTGNAELNEHPLSKYARGIFFSPNYNKQFFDAINWANNLGDYKTQLNLINPFNNSILENLQNNDYLDHIYFGLSATNNTSTNDDVWKFDGFKILQDNVNIITNNIVNTIDPYSNHIYFGIAPDSPLSASSYWVLFEWEILQNGVNLLPSISGIINNATYFLTPNSYGTFSPTNFNTEIMWIRTQNYHSYWDTYNKPIFYVQVNGLDGSQLSSKYVLRQYDSTQGYIVSSSDTVNWTIRGTWSDGTIVSGKKVTDLINLNQGEAPNPEYKEMNDDPYIDEPITNNYCGAQFSINGNGNIIVDSARNRTWDLDYAPTRAYIWNGNEWVNRGSVLDHGAASSPKPGYSGGYRTDCAILNNDGTRVATSSYWGNRAQMYQWNNNIGTEGDWEPLGQVLTQATDFPISGYPRGITMNSDGTRIALHMSPTGSYVYDYNPATNQWEQKGSHITYPPKTDPSPYTMYGQSSPSPWFVGGAHNSVWGPIRGSWHGMRGVLSGDGNVFAMSSNGDEALTYVWSDNDNDWIRRGGDTGFLIKGDHIKFNNIINGTNDTELGEGLESIAINYDGSRIVVGAPRISTSLPYAKVYEWNGTNWEITDNMIFKGKSNYDMFAYSSSISDDGNTVAFGSIYGWAEIWKWNPDNSPGSKWSHFQTITGSDSSYRLGYSVQLNNDATILAIGEPDYNSTSHTKTGRIITYINNPYIFDKANGDWSTHWNSNNKPLFYTQANIPINSNQLTLEYNKSANSSPETTIPSKYPPFYWDYNGDLNTQQGYVIKASSEYSNHTKHLKYNPFLITTPGSANSLPGNYSNRGWLSIWQPDGIDSGTHGNVLSGIDTGSSTGGVASRNGPWLQMSFPFPIKVTTVDMYHNDDDLNDRITEGYFYGSNDEITYYELVQLSSSSDNLNSYTKTSKNTITINSEIAYKHLLLQITAQNTIKYVEVGKMEIFGIKPGFENTPTSGHIVSSESPDGPWIVRASWNTAEELINTVSNPPSILKYPNWIDYSYIPTIGQSSPISQEGYTIKASSEWHGWNGIYEKWQPFYMTVDKLTTSSDAGWLSANNTINSNGYANNSNMLSGIDQNSSTNNVTTRNGPWLQLSLPNTIKLTTVDMYSRHDQDRTIEGYFYGSNDETTWYELVEISSASDNLSGYDNTSKNTVTINSNVEYKHYIYQVTRAMKKYGSVKKLDYYSSINNVPIPIQL